MSPPKVGEILAPARRPDEDREAYVIRRRAGNKAVKAWLRGILAHPSVVFEETGDGTYAIPVTWTALRDKSIWGPKSPVLRYIPVKHVRSKGVVKVRDKEESRAGTEEGRVAAPVDGTAEQTGQEAPGADADRGVDQAQAGDGPL